MVDSSPNDLEAKASTSQPRVGWTLVAACLVIAILKLWIVSGDDILAYRSPHDAEWFLQSAEGWHWFRDYDFMTLIRRPVYPLFIALSEITSIPLRLSTELLFLTAAFAFVAALVKAGQRSVLATGMFALIVLNPWSFYVFRIVVSDVLYAPLLLFALAAMIMVLVERPSQRLKWATMTGLALALLWETRKESELIAIYVVAWAIIIVLSIPKSERARRWKRELLVGAGVPVAIIACISIAVRTANYASYGVFADDEISWSPFTAAHRALLRIKPDKPIRYVPVPFESRSRAYAVSPAFAELRDSLELFPEKVNGEIPAFWFFWILRESVATKGHHTTAAAAAEFYGKIADEINAACDSGKLPSRQVYSDFLDPSVSSYAGYLPSSFLSLARLFISTDEPIYLNDLMFDHTPRRTTELFDRVASRRVIEYRGPQMVIQGWAFCTGDDQLESVEISGAGRVLATTTTFTPRPDVVAAYGGDAPQNTAFTLWVPFKVPAGNKGKIVFNTRRSEKIVQACVVMEDGKIKFGPPPDQTLVKFYFERAEGVPGVVTLPDIVRGWIWRSYGWVVIVLTFVGVAAILWLFVRRASVSWDDPAFAAIVLLGVVTVSRVALFTLLDAAAWRCDTEPRFLLPVFYLYPCALVLLAGMALRVARRHSSTHGPIATVPVSPVRMR